MADDPENLTLRLLREIREENAAFREENVAFREEMREFRAETGQRLDRLETQVQSQGETLGKVIDAVTHIAKVQEQHSAILMQHSEMLAGVVRVQKTHGARLNILDERLAILESKAGFVTA
jgi:hypothetical protein